MPWTAERLPDLTGTTAVVTGATSGIGRAVAQALAEHGAGVVIACRDPQKGAAVADRLPAGTRVEPLDLASLASVRAFAARWTGSLDLLVNNAGVMSPPRRRENADGVELQFATNHLGHFALTGLLLPALLASARPRVVTVSSIAHLEGDRGVLEGNPVQGYHPQRSYSQSKLANVLFALELQRRASAAGTPLVSTAAHPGVAATNLVASRDGLGSLPPVRLLAPLLSRLLPSAEAGARATLYAATEAAPGSYSGPQSLHETRGPVGPARLNPYAADPDLARELWERSEQWTGVSYPF